MTLDELLTTLDAVEEGDGWVAHCPAHADSHPSLRVAVADNGKLLLKCRAGCSTPEVLEQLGLSSFADVDTNRPGNVTRTVNSAPREPDVAAVASLAADLDKWSRALTPEAVAYAERRFGLSEADCRRLGIGYAADLGGGPRLVVPFRDATGAPRGYQARALTTDAKVRWLGPHNPPGGQWATVAWFPATSGWEEVLVCEGPGDGLTACAAGYDAVAIRGASLAENPRTVDAVAALVGGRTAVIAGDGDPAGRRFSARLSDALASRGVPVKVLALPDGQDLTDWHEQDGPRFATQLIRAVMAARPVVAAEALLGERDQRRYPFTDLGQAAYVRDYILAQGSQVRYTPEAGFFLLERGVWRPDKLHTVRAYAQAAARRTAELGWQLRESGEVKKSNEWLQFATYAESTRGLDDALAELRALPDVATDIGAFDQHPDLLAVRNGVIDLRTGDLLEHDPDLLLTRRVDVNYDPAAEAPRWVQFLREVLPQPGMPEFVQRLVGYGITGRTTEQAFVVLWGTGSNGKSVFTNVLTRVFGELTVTTPFSTFESTPSSGIPNDIAALRGARLVFASEGEAGRPMAEALLKRITGQDRIAARFMRKEFFEFTPTFLLFMATNDKPNFRGQDEGLWRRVKLIPWERYFAPHERDHYLADKLEQEREGILAWAVAGARQWYATGLQEPSTVIDATKEYRVTSDALVGFMPGVYVHDRDASTPIPGTKLFNDYLDWCEQENMPPKERWTRRAFFRALEERGLVRKKHAVGVVFFGVRPAEAADDEEDQVPAPSGPTQPTGPAASGVAAWLTGEDA